MTLRPKANRHRAGKSTPDETRHTAEGRGTGNAPNKDCWVWTADPLEAPDQPENARSGRRPVCGNGEKLSPFQCLEKLNALGRTRRAG